MKELGNTPADKNYKPSGISRAEEAALKAYPVNMTPLNYLDLIEQFGGKTEIDVNTYPRRQFQEGYEQAEKDLAPLIESATIVYEAWNGGTMDDVRRGMDELGKRIKED